MKERSLDICPVPDAREELAGGMELRIANNRNADPEQLGELALGNRVDGVVGALGVDIGLKFAQQRIHIQIVEDYDVVYGSKRRDKRRARPFGKDGAPISLQLSRARIRIDTDDEDVSFSACRLQVPNMSCMEHIEYAICKRDLAAGAPMLIENGVQSLA